MLQTAPIPQWAAFYRSLGIQVVPSLEPAEDPNWKRPVGRWQQHTKTPVTDDVFAGWYGDFGQHVKRTNLGIITGSVSGGQFILDLDTYANPGAMAWWTGLLALHNHDMAIETPTQRTGGGGLQMLFRAPDGWRPPTGKTTMGVDIRGEGGFAVLPPSRHSSGKEYEWLPGQCPDECEVATAPAWLCAAIDALLGVQPELAPGAGNGVTDNVVRMPRTLTPAAALTPIGGFRQDLREEYMRDLVWAAVVGLWRECPYIDAATADINARKVWQDYLAHTESRLAGSPETLAARLEQEGRGWSLFCDKWRRAMAQWDGKVARAGGQPDPHPDPQDRKPAPEKGDGIPPEEDEFAAKSAEAGIMPFTRFQWVDQGTIPQRDFLYADHYVRKFVSAYIATDGVGKSTLAIADALAMASGKTLLGHAPKTRLRVVYWNGEDPFDELQRRVVAAALHYGLKAQDLDDYLMVDSGRLLPIVIAEESRNGLFMADKMIQSIIRSIRHNGIDAMVIDPLISSHRVQEKDNNAMERVIKAWANIADETNCSINLVAHARKTNGNEVTVEDNRGASSAMAAYRSAKVFNQMSQGEAEKAGIKNRRLYFRVDSGKSSMLPPSELATWYRLTSHELLNGPMGTSGDKVGVLDRWAMPDAFDGVTTDSLRLVQNAVGAGEWRADARAARWVGDAVAAALGMIIEQDRGRIKEMIKIWIASGALKIVLKQDATRQERPFVEVGTWA